MEKPEFRETQKEELPTNSVTSNKASKNKRKSRKRKSDHCSTPEDTLPFESNEFRINEQSGVHSTTTESKQNGNDCVSDKNAEDTIVQCDNDRQSDESSKKKKKRKQRKRKSKNLIPSEDTAIQESDRVNNDNSIICESNEHQDNNSVTIDDEHTNSISVVNVNDLGESDTVTAYKENQMSEDRNSHEIDNNHITCKHTSDASSSVKNEDNKSEPENNDIEIKENTEQNDNNPITHEIYKQSINDPENENTNDNNLITHEQTNSASSSFRKDENLSEPETNDIEIKDESEQNDNNPITHEANKQSIVDSQNCEDKPLNDDKTTSYENNGCAHRSYQESEKSKDFENLKLVESNEERNIRETDENKQVLNCDEPMTYKSYEQDFCDPTPSETKQDDSDLIAYNTKKQDSDGPLSERDEHKSQYQIVYDIDDEECRNVIITDSANLINSEINSNNKYHDDSISNENKMIRSLITHTTNKQNIDYSNPIPHGSDNHCDPTAYEVKEDSNESVIEENEHKIINEIIYDVANHKNISVAENNDSTSENDERPDDSVFKENNQINENSIDHETYEKDSESIAHEINNYNCKLGVTHENTQGVCDSEAYESKQQEDTGPKQKIDQVFHNNPPTSKFNKDDPINSEKSKNEASPIHKHIQQLNCNVTVVRGDNELSKQSCDFPVIDSSEQNQATLEVEGHDDDLKPSNADEQNSNDSLTKGRNSRDLLSSGQKEQKVEDVNIIAQDEQNIGDSANQNQYMDISPFTLNVSPPNLMSSSEVVRVANQMRGRIEQSSLKRPSSSAELMPPKRRKNEVIPASKGFFVTLAAIPVSCFLLVCHCFCALFSIFKR